MSLPMLSTDAAAVAAETGTSTALSTIRFTQEGEAFLRYESDASAFSRITLSGGVTPGTFAAPVSDGLIPLFRACRCVQPA